MFIKDRSEDAFKPIRFRGVWWIPGSKKRIHGELVFSTPDGGTLELEGELTSGSSKAEVIHGSTAEKKHITIFNAMSIGRTWHGDVSKQTLKVYDLWVGPRWFSHKEKITFQEYSFGIHNLENWADLKCFSSKISKGLRKVTASYKLPKKILLFADDKCSIFLASGYSGAASSMGQTEISIEHYPRILIQAKNGRLPYYGESGSIAEREWMIFVLIALLMGRPTWQFGFAGLISPLVLEEKRVSPEISFRHYYQRNIDNAENTRKPTEFDLLFPFRFLRSGFRRMTAKFFKLFHDNESQIDVFFQLLSKKTVFEASTLPNLLFAFEELETNLLKKANAPSERNGEARARRVRKQLEPHCANCGKADWEWAMQRLSWQGLSYTWRLRIAFGEMRALYPGLDKKVEKALVEYLSKTRNTYAHEAKATSEDYVLYIQASYWMAEFMTLMLLKACGLPLKTIQTVYFRYPGPARVRTEQFFQRLRPPPSSPPSQN